MTTWQGDKDVTIDRFDARSHLDYIQEYEGEKQQSIVNNETQLKSSELDEETISNYERYRTIIQNEALDSM
jgi:hypothetical protein